MGESFVEVLRWVRVTWVEKLSWNVLWVSRLKQGTGRAKNSIGICRTVLNPVLFVRTPLWVMGRFSCVIIRLEILVPLS